MAAAKKSFGKRLWKWTKRIVLVMFVSSLSYCIVCRWLMPPTTITQITNSFHYSLKKEYVSWDDLGYNIKLAALASEDQTFPQHGGFDWDAIQRSLHPKKGKKTRIPLGGGASTITQETAKNVFLIQGGGVFRKIPEAYFTKLIEWTWGKKRILEIYLNVIEMGPGVFGAEAAAQSNFHKHAKDLSRTEAAMLVACFPNPKKFSVVPASKRVAWRSPQILREMNNIETEDDVQALLK
jgi:monofunctional biosynthetic peptidoglycan transglycosylase